MEVRHIYDAARHARLVELAQRMLDLHKQLTAQANSRSPNPQMKTMLQRQIDMTDKQPSELLFANSCSPTPVRQLLFADQLVYELYELTEEEIKIVEGA